jgi:hypothetical protein
MLSNPVLAFKTISRDPELAATVELEAGHRRYTALDIQRVFVEAAGRYLEGDAAVDAQWHRVWEDWARVIDWLETQPEALDRHLDWRIKRKFLRAQIERKGVDWRHAIAREMDIKYHRLDDEMGFFYLLQEAGWVEDLLTGDEVEEAMISPPPSTRAYLRGHCAREYTDQVVSANWDILTLVSGAGSEARAVRLHLSDPTTYTRAEIEPLSGTHVEPEQFIARLRDLGEIKSAPLVTDGR